MISKEEVKKLADLARIALIDNEVENLQRDMERILGYVSEISKAKAPVDWQAAGPELRNVFRADGQAHQAGEFSEALLAQAPARQRDYVKVKKILEEGKL